MVSCSIIRGVESRKELTHNYALCEAESLTEAYLHPSLCRVERQVKVVPMGIREEVEQKGQARGP